MRTCPVALDVALREEHERAAFAVVAEHGRAALADEALVVPEHTVKRLLGAAEDSGDPLDRMFAWARPFEGARVLEICAFDGVFGVVLARGGADVTSVDLCAPLVEVARRRARANRVEDRMRALTMSVHALDFPDGSFDVVFGKASLHHLDLDRARDEIVRVLRPAGIGVFAEPIALSPALAAVRARVPVPVDRDSPDERPLSAADLARFASAFASEERAYFRLFARLARIAPAAEDTLARADRLLLDRLPALHRYAGICVIRVRKSGVLR